MHAKSLKISYNHLHFHHIKKIRDCGVNMLDNEKITSMKQDDIDKLTNEELDKYSNFKMSIEDYCESVKWIQSANRNVDNKSKQKNTMFRLSKQYIPFKVYFETVGFVILFGIISSYYIITSNKLQIAHSSTMMFIFFLYALLTILAAFLPIIVYPKKDTEYE